MTPTQPQHTSDSLAAFPFQRSCPFAPPDEYAQLRSESALPQVRLPDGSAAWLVTRYDDVRAVLASPDFSADGTRADFPFIKPEQRIGMRKPPFLRKDPPEHTAERRALIQEFTLKRITTLRPAIQAAANTLIGDTLGRTPPVDLVEALALPLPSLVICRILGVPYSDHEYFQAQTRMIVDRRSTQEEFVAALGNLHEYLGALLTEKQRRPVDDLMSRLATQHLEPAGGLGRERVLRMCTLLLNAGHETTANMIALGTAALLENPGQLAALRSDPALLPGAVEELLRYLSIADHIPTRVAARDTEIAGTPIRAGEGVIPLLAAADWDTAMFPEAGDLDITQGSRHHVAFGYGVHQCLGANLARAELEITFAALFERIPGLRLAAPVEELAYKHDGLLWGLHELPVTWEV